MLNISRSGAVTRRIWISWRLRSNSRSSRALIGPADHLVLQVVDLVAELVEDGEVSVDDVVGESPQQMARAPRQDVRRARPEMPGGAWIPPLAVVAQQEARRQHEVELALVDVAVVEAEREDDHVEQVVDLLELGPLVAFDDVLAQERVQLQDLARLCAFSSGPAPVTSIQTRAARRARAFGSSAIAASPSNSRQLPASRTASLTTPGRPGLGVASRVPARPPTRLGARRRQKAISP